MLENFIVEKIHARALSRENYYEVIEYLMSKGSDLLVQKFLLALDSFGMTKQEVVYLTEALRDSGRVVKYNQSVLEKHSTGGVGDSSSLVIIPILASMGYKVIKTSGKSLVYTNGTADRFKAIPNFKVKLTSKEIKQALDKTNACILSHNGDVCPADSILHQRREQLHIAGNINLMAASIASKKLASGAKAVLVDVKFGDGSLIPDYATAKRLSTLLKYIFTCNKVKSVIVITNTLQTFGEGIGNALEVVDALNVLQGKKCLLRKVAVKYAVEMANMISPTISRKDLYDMVLAALDSGSAYNSFLNIVTQQGGDAQILKDAKLFNPRKSINILSTKDGYVGDINSQLLGEIVRRLCSTSHDDNIGITIHVKIGDYVKKGDIVLSFYYNQEEELEECRSAITGAVRLTSKKIKPERVIKSIVR